MMSVDSTSLGYAKSLKARLQEIQEQQRRDGYVEHQPSGVADKVDILL